MIELLTEIFGLGKGVCELLNTKESRKYIDSMIDLEKRINEEKAKGDNAIDSKIEDLKLELKTILKGISYEISNHTNNPVSTS